MNDASMSTPNTCSRPWYCRDDLVEDYKTVGRNGGDLQMMKAAKWLRSMIVNVGIIGIAFYALSLDGVNVTVVAGLALTSLAAYNGVEIADYQALAQAIVEMSQETENDQK